ncbi:hypothetical protein [Allobaculum sp. Allo2]|nr:hypothetical protein [Allobaculum sp. Allo2]UNT94037.1 hypothetical protein KWG61_05140 [Allobaculum sp. Allo2]
MMAVIHDALIRLILPSVKREIRSELRENAHKKPFRALHPISNTCSWLDR